LAKIFWPTMAGWIGANSSEVMMTAPPSATAMGTLSASSTKKLANRTA
jgi:hypothetical protein